MPKITLVLVFFIPRPSPVKVNVSFSLSALIQSRTAVIRLLSLIAENADIKKKVFRMVDRFMGLVGSCLFN